jgi:hypothetical protein
MTAATRNNLGLVTDRPLLSEKMGQAVGQHRSSSSSGGDDGVEARVAKLEAAVEHIQADISDLKADLRGFRAQTHTDLESFRSQAHTDLESLRAQNHTELAVLRADSNRKFLWLLGTLGALFAVMAKGFGWLKL